MLQASYEAPLDPQFLRYEVLVGTEGPAMIENKVKARWSECYPYELLERMRECPVVYAPLGLCEPHGQVAAYGLDLIKAEYLCEESARRYGGVVAPPLGYQMHETGGHALWLETTIGAENPRMTSMPPHVLLYFFLYQLRAFANAGFAAAIVITGHAGGNENDLRLVASRFSAEFGFRTIVCTDGELAAGKYYGDHAGRYELSQLMYLRPELVNLKLAALAEQPGSGGSLAIGHDAMEASPELGRSIIEDSLDRMGQLVSEAKGAESRSSERISIQRTEKVWVRIWEDRKQWRTSGLSEREQALPATSIWREDHSPYRS